MDIENVAGDSFREDIHANEWYNLWLAQTSGKLTEEVHFESEKLAASELWPPQLLGSSFDGEALRHRCSLSRRSLNAPIGGDRGRAAVWEGDRNCGLGGEAAVWEV
jgi:hypothetical protein